MSSGRPYIVSFLPHSPKQLAFIPTEQNQDIYRHTAGILATVNKRGNFDLRHTGGMFLRIGQAIEHEGAGAALCRPELAAAL